MSSLLFSARACLLLLAFFLPLSLTFTHVMLAALLALSLALALGQHSSHPPVPGAKEQVVFTLLLLAWITLRTYGSTGSRTDVLNEWGRYVQLMIVPLVIFLHGKIAALGPEERQARWVLLRTAPSDQAHPATALPYQMLAALVAGILLSVMLSHLRALGWTEMPFADARLHPAIFKHHILQGTLTALMVGLCLGFAAMSSRPCWRLTLWACVAAGIVSILWVLPSRTALLALGATLAVHGIVSGKARGLAAMAALGLACAAAWPLLIDTSASLSRMVASLRTLGASPDNLLAGALGTGTAEPSTSVRLSYLTASLAIGTERPWFGHGTGAFLHEFCRAMGPRWCEIARATSAQPHNQFAMFFVEQGLMGVALFSAWLAWPLMLLRRQILARRRQDPPSSGPSQAAVLLVLSIWVTAVVHAALDSILHLNTEGLLYPLLMAVGLMLLTSGPSTHAATTVGPHSPAIAPCGSEPTASDQRP